MSSPPGKISRQSVQLDGWSSQTLCSTTRSRLPIVGWTLHAPQCRHTKLLLNTQCTHTQHNWHSKPILGFVVVSGWPLTPTDDCSAPTCSLYGAQRNICCSAFNIKKKRFTAHKVRTAHSGTSCRIVPVTNLNKYLHQDTSETEMSTKISVNNGKEKLYLKKNTTF